MQGPHPSDSGDEHPAAARWQRLVTDRLAEVERVAPDRGALSGAFWDSRADRYADNARISRDEADPFLRRLRRVTPSTATAIDVGAGTGRFTLALAPSAKHVTAVDPSAGMLAILRRDADALGVENLTVVHGTWEEAAVERADVVFSAFVMTLVPDGRSFVTKLDESAGDRVLLYLGGYCADAVLDPLWRHFHGAPRVPGPSYLDALAVIREAGIEPDVKVVEVPNRRRFASVAEAVEYYRDGLLLADTPQVRHELTGLLDSWLLGRAGAFRSPLRATPAAIVEWTPGPRR